MKDIFSEKNIPILGSNQKLMGTDVFFNKEKNNLPVVIYIHGFNGFKDWGNFDLIATHFANAGYFFIKMNLSHNGTSINAPETFVDLEAFGNNNYSKELFDVTCIIDWVSSDNCPYKYYLNTNRISLIGHSRGGGIAIIKAAADQRVKSLITWASIAECKTPWGNMRKEKLALWQQEGVMYYTNKRTNQQLPLYYQLYEDYLQNEKHLSIQSAIKKIQIPILLCHGTADTAVPITSMHDLKNWQAKAEWFSVNADHVFGRKHPWLENYLPEAMQIIFKASIDFLDAQKE